MIIKLCGLALGAVIMPNIAFFVIKIRRAIFAKRSVANLAFRPIVNPNI